MLSWQTPILCTLLALEIQALKPALLNLFHLQDLQRLISPGYLFINAISHSSLRTE
jgi:hypothetical protein